MSDPSVTREEVARIELGTTDIKPRLAWILVFAFLATAVVPPSLQIALKAMKRETNTLRPSAVSVEMPREPERRPGIRTLSDLAGLVPSARQLRQFEARLDESSLLTRTLAPWVGCVIKGCLRGGDEQVYLGHDGWLFYRPSVDSVTSVGFLTPDWQRERLRIADPSSPPPHPDPLEALSQFSRQLAARGVALVVVPTPGKESLYPEELVPRWNSGMTVPLNPSLDRFKSELTARGISVFDPTDVLLELKNRAGERVFLKTDTHWSASAMEQVASRLATWLQERGLVPAHGPVNWRVRPQTVSNVGDLAVMLNLPKRQSYFPPETIQISRVLTSGDRPWESEPAAPVLLMGDSFCNIYSLAAMGWGESAGFAEHLSRSLGQPLDRLVINAGGASGTRQELVRELAAGRDRLAGKRVVIYQFAARELAFGDWRLLELPQPAVSSAETARGDGELIVQGRVNAIARLPRPGSVPYKDCLIAIHLTQVRGTSPPSPKADLLVYTFGMRDNQWLPISAVPVGAEVHCRLREWEKVEGRFGSYNRAELDDLNLLSLPTYWADDVAR